LKHLQLAYSEAEAKGQELSEKLAEGLVMILLNSESDLSIINEQN